jgi:hypothetical protein
MYPLFKKFTIIGLIFGALALLILKSFIAGLAFFVVFFCAGLLWRANEPPILSFALAFQWIFIVAGYLYTTAGGDLGEYELIGNIDLAVVLSLIGLICIAVGMRLGLAVIRKRHPEQPLDQVNLRTLFWATVITYSVSWVIEISPMDIFFNAAQILYAVLSFREVMLCLLWLVILKRREGYRYGWMAFVVALLPRFTSRQSTFKELVFMLLVVALIEFKPWIKTAAQRAWNFRLVTAFAITSILLFAAGVVWEGAVKPVWRSLDFQGTPLETMDVFAHVTAATTSEMDEETGVRAFVKRLSSITQFALVLDRVPTVVPFENGGLTKRALTHVLFPRVLFPGKENLGSDSWLAEEYAGLNVGEDTSVGIGYMAEFYVDFGMAGMMPCLLALGFFFGVVYRIIFLFSPSSAIASALVIAPFMGNFITYEGSLPKILGGFIMTTAILVVMSRATPLLIHAKYRPKLAPVVGGIKSIRPGATRESAA